ELPLNALFEAPTVEGLAAVVDRALQQAPVAAPALRRMEQADASVLERADEPSPPRTHAASFAQQRLWFLHQLEPDSPFYN
ncbi:hypothetical protein RSW78_26415, partial [Escherichia coli]|uniref:hypothetical protein n=1 Tax=Escherichia coli TaxID=562 RepID=UPI0028DE68E2